jgi:hypothetical protein
MAGTIDRERLWEKAQDLAEEMVDAGANPEHAARAVAEFLDAMVPLHLLLPGLPGMAAELADGPLIEQVILLLLGLFRQDPEKRAARRERRLQCRRERMRKRAKRRARRQP